MGVRKKTKKPPSDYRDQSWPKGLYRRPNGRFFRRRQVDGDRGPKFLKTKNLNRAITEARRLNEGIEDKAMSIADVVNTRSRPFEEVTENKVLRGARQTLERDEPIVLCEVLRGRCEAGIEREIGYGYFDITDIGFEERKHIEGDPTYNFLGYLFVTGKRMEIVRPFSSAAKAARGSPLAMEITP